MILTGRQIASEMGCGLEIVPFNPKQLNPNSYNLRLADELLVYDELVCLDMAKENHYHSIKMDKDGFVLQPQKLYLGRTMEWTATDKFVPMLEGRSSVGRLGISIHATAGFGDIGFNGFWTLEISCIEPVRIYPGVEICQIYYHTIDESLWDGKNSDVAPGTYADGKYQNNDGIQPSFLFKEFENL